jgi:uncharacterized repeat protein (TIGR01451 family)
MNHSSTCRLVLVICLFSALWTRTLSFLQAEALPPSPASKTDYPARLLLIPPCQFVYPITVRNTSVPAVGEVPFDILDGASNHALSSGNNDRGFLAWNPYVTLAVSTLENELIYPELSITDYTNANNPNDHDLSESDYVKSLLGNNGGVNDTSIHLLDDLVGQDIIIPVWDNFDTVTSAYHISGFIRVRIIAEAPNGISLVGNDPFIMATYLGPVDLTQCPLLSITKVGPSAVTAGDLITYTLTVSNGNGAIASNLLITDALPAGTSYIEGGSLVGGVVSWTVPSLAGSQSLTRTFSVTAGQTITNSLYRVSQEFYLGGTGLYSATGQASVVTVVEPPVVVEPTPVLTITKHGPATATTSSLITYTLRVTNSGNLTATYLIITDALPADANYVSGGSLVNGVVSWIIPSLAIDQSLTRTFSVTAGQTITNSLYRVSTGGSISATGRAKVVTTIIPEEPNLIYLPVIVK